MPLLEHSDLCHTCVVWEKTGDTINVEPIVLPGVQHRCRWVPRRSSTLDSRSQVIATDVNLAIDCCLPVGSIVWKGGLGDIPGTADPTVPDEDLYVVVSGDSADDIKGRVTRTEAKLIRFNDSMPTIYDPLE
jgi:hypothetical protein